MARIDKTRLVATSIGLAITACGGEPPQPLVAPPPVAAAPSAMPAKKEPEREGFVTVEQGRMRGLVRHGVASYRGVPFAAPPVGDLRFRPPEPPATWDGTRDATRFASRCVEIDLLTRKVLGGDEDCLNLNVFVPAIRPAESMPVLVFLHGGQNVRGAASQQSGAEYAYVGDWLASHGPAMVVTIDYRVGAFGFLAHPSLRAEGPLRNGGNMGLLDAIAALSWVKKNAAAFGADASRVTLFGQSSGAIDTCALLTSPLAAGLFSRVISMSGGCHRKSLGDAENEGKRLAEQAGCADASTAASCLRALTPTALAATTVPTLRHGGTNFGPVADDVVVLSHSVDVMSAGKHNAAAAIVGTTRNELDTLVKNYVDKPPKSEAEYKKALRTLFAERGAAIHALYPAHGGTSPEAALVAALGDVFVTCPSRALALALVRGQREPVFRYVFAHRFENEALATRGALHGFDTAFVFHELEAAHADVALVPSASDVAVSDAMAGYVLRFAKTGDPNGGGAPEWPRFDAANEAHVIFDDAVHSGKRERSPACDALEATKRGGSGS